MKKKIVHIAQSPGGVAEYLYMFLKNFDNENYENYMIVSEDYKEIIDKFDKYAKKIFFVPMQRDINLKSDATAVIQIHKILKVLKPDIVYLHSSKAGAIGRIALLFNFKTKIIYNAHGWYFNAQIGAKKKKIFTIIEKILALKVDQIINISKSEYETAIENKIANSKKMCIIENGIDFSKFEGCEQYREETRTKYNIKKEDIVIGVVGRLTEQKDPLTSIKAFNELYKKNKNVKLMFVGSGELEENVKEYSKQNGLDENIIITGWVENVEKYIPAFDIAILPSKWEGFGLAIIEYMACNKPIVASNIGGISNIITNEENGYLISCGDYKQLYNYIRNLIKDSNIQNKFITANNELKDKYDIKNVIKKHEEIFKKLI